MIKHFKKNIMIYIAPILILIGFGLDELSMAISRDWTGQHNDLLRTLGWIWVCAGIVWIPIGLAIHILARKK